MSCDSLWWIQVVPYELPESSHPLVHIHSRYLATTVWIALSLPHKIFLIHGSLDTRDMEAPTLPVNSISLKCSPWQARPTTSSGAPLPLPAFLYHLPRGRGSSPPLHHPYVYVLQGAAPELVLFVCGPCRIGLTPASYSLDQFIWTWHSAFLCFSFVNHSP